MNDGEQILLTGATGFIGSHVLEKLCAAGSNVLVLARPESNLSYVRSIIADVRLGDIRNLQEIRESVRGCTQVIHTAALASDWGPKDEFHRTNVMGTMNVLEACRLERIDHVIITGSISSYGEENSPHTKDETFPYLSHYPYFLDHVFPCRLNWYRDSKALATKEAVEFARAYQINLTVLEPVWVYGEREFGTGFYNYVKAVHDGQQFMPGSTRNLFHVIYAKDLAKAFLLAAERKLPGVHRIIVGNPSVEPMHRVFTIFCQEAGLRPPRLLPKWASYPLAFGLELASTAVRSRQPPLLTRGRVDMFYDSIQYSTDKARRCLGFECDYSLEQSIRQTVAWYKTNHYL
jgi:2-alkyl-3-oxoalkanoate reductase